MLAVYSSAIELPVTSMLIDPFFSSFVLALSILLIARRYNKTVIPARSRQSWGYFLHLPQTRFWWGTWLSVMAFFWFVGKSEAHGGMTMPWHWQVVGVLSMVVLAGCSLVIVSRHVTLPQIDVFKFEFRRETEQVVSVHFNLWDKKARKRFEIAPRMEKHRRILEAFEAALKEARFLPATITTIEFLSPWFAGSRHDRTLRSLEALLKKAFPSAVIEPQSRLDLQHVVLVNMRYCYAKRFSRHALRKLAKLSTYREGGFLVHLSSTSGGQS